MQTPTSPQLSIDSAITTFLRTSQNTASPNTIHITRQALNLFQNYLRTHKNIPTHLSPFSDITFIIALDFLDYLQRTKSVETEHAYSRAILNFYNFLETIYHIPSNNAADVAHYIATHKRPRPHTPPSVPYELLNQFFHKIQMGDLPLPATNPQSRQYLRTLRDNALVLVLASGGLHIHEICNARVADLNTHTHTITVSITHSHVPLTRQTTTLITTYITARHAIDQQQKHLPQRLLPLFARHDKKAGSKILPISRWTVANIVNNWLRQYEPATFPETRITPQTLRHYYVASTLEQTDNIAAAQTAARHKHKATTRAYLQVLKTK